MTHRRLPRFAAMAVLTAALSVGAAATAFGYWTANGAGAGAADTGATASITLSGGAPTGSLYPGTQANVLLTATNPNSAAVHITSLALDVSQGTNGYAVDGAHSGCSVAALTYATQTNGGAGWNVPARVGVVNGTLAITLTNAVTMSAAAANACQGATFTVYLVAN